MAFSNIIYISKLQRVQNAAARLITNTRKYDHITPALYNLHWLPVFYRVYFKILIVAFNAAAPTLEQPSSKYSGNNITQHF